MKISAARTAAFDILLRIERERAFSSILLPLAEATLSPSDRALCHELVLGTLRRQIYLDRVIESLAGNKKVDIEVRIAIRLGLYQILFLDRVPQYSAINESVNLVGRAKKTSAKGFANAILRRATRGPVSFDFPDEIERLTVESSHPRWLLERWIEKYGLEAASQIAFANNRQPSAAIRLTARSGEAAGALVNRADPGHLAAGAYILDRRDETSTNLAQSGEIYFQDEASQLAARAIEIPVGGRFLDVCAAPGSKTGLIAARYSGAAKLLVAGDLHTSRVEMLRANCDHQGAGFVNLVQYDAAKALPFADETFDSVLVDVPCSGTGTIMHNPEIRYSLTPGEIAELPGKQLEILKNASNTVIRGGLLIYSTCSLEPEENEDVCRRFLEMSGDFTQVAPSVPEAILTGDRFGRTWPQRDGVDGFFIAAFRKN